MVYAALGVKASKFKSLTDKHNMAKVQVERREDCGPAVPAGSTRLLRLDLRMTALWPLSALPGTQRVSTLTLSRQCLSDCAGRGHSNIGIQRQQAFPECARRRDN